ncbi:MAG TPA: MSHA biogenesis protein MshE, partial [Marinobacter adhaerens]|nr:MSHA biogenesis protein MshE [Marinobacter adhaerens]
VYEMLEMNEAMLDALRRQNVSEFTKAARLSPLYRPLGQCAMDFALQGTTTLEEVARVAATSEGEFSPEDDIPLPDEPIGGGA